MSGGRRAIIVRGGWDGHEPVAQTELLVPFLVEHGYEVEAFDATTIYADAERLAATDLIVQSWTQGAIEADEFEGLRSAIAAGTGFAGWHGGIVDSFRASAGYLQLTGGQFVDHPGGIIPFEVEVRSSAASHPIVDGITRFSLESEQYWVLSDDLNDVLAETVIAGGDGTPWARPVRSPTIWTRQWGEGRVFVSTIGHRPADLDVPEVRRTIERGLLWASR